jgi:hypothetical protein
MVTGSEATLSVSKISCSQDGVYEYGCVLGCCAVWSDRSLPTFQRFLQEAAGTSTASVELPPGYRLRNNPEHSHLHFLLGIVACRV